MKHNFKNSLEYEKNMKNEYINFYKKKFKIKNIENFDDYKENPYHKKKQDSGIDRKIVLSNSNSLLKGLGFNEEKKEILIEEKTRKKDYNDILIETYSKYDYEKGWIYKTEADLFVYGIETHGKLKKIYLINMQELKNFYKSEVKCKINEKEYEHIIKHNYKKNAKKNITINICNKSTKVFITKAYNSVDNHCWNTLSVCIKSAIIKNCKVHIKQLSET